MDDGTSRSFATQSSEPNSRKRKLSIANIHDGSKKVKLSAFVSTPENAMRGSPEDNTQSSNHSESPVSNLVQYNTESLDHLGSPGGSSYNPTLSGSEHQYEINSSVDSPENISTKSADNSLAKPRNGKYSMESICMG